MICLPVAETPAEAVACAAGLAGAMFCGNARTGQVLTKRGRCYEVRVDGRIVRVDPEGALASLAANPGDARVLVVVSSPPGGPGADGLPASPGLKADCHVRGQRTDRRCVECDDLLPPGYWRRCPVCLRAKETGGLDEIYG